jgi:hypothetical protein
LQEDKTLKKARKTVPFYFFEIFLKICDNFVGMHKSKRKINRKKPLKQAIFNAKLCNINKKQGVAFQFCAT